MRAKQALPGPQDGLLMSRDQNWDGIRDLLRFSRAERVTMQCGSEHAAGAIRSQRTCAGVLGGLAVDVSS